MGLRSGNMASPRFSKRQDASSKAAGSSYTSVREASAGCSNPILLICCRYFIERSLDLSELLIGKHRLILLDGLQRELATR